MQFQEVTSKHNALHEELVACQTKCLGGCKQDKVNNLITLSKLEQVDFK
jgi:hypothetical protein